ncbi:type III-A CRISPR-associated RAMP protein Csm3 [Syntrophotalea acetylenica]|jgi:CRISPR-associated protein Csm3|uniref:type III-A CRISPR-associated RAMP protein Csm3 n=1 Tax=Syntrophotalea acetylenica TaxID=29542 RepID=UPI002A3650CB|nr:type III-A CRISPR-associated RAMP protein Csm3 [Syntrophotalea acetylenica]MDY0261380.1 type III-A CRISPR-associated RAMP protein Csm3 [Syntrophotalea acetylenica]
MQLEMIKQITGTITVLTGLHIGAGKDSLEIGGLDQPVIKHPLTSEPYIPGSSIKGKMRSLLEISRFSSLRPETRQYVVKGKPCACAQPGCPACTIFGTSAAEKGPELGPTRLIVRDASLTTKWREKFKENELTMEIKYENTIDRVRGVADHPRPLERVPAGVEFDFHLSFKVFHGDPADLIEDVFRGLRLIELDALGGNSSRGCGQVRFDNLRCDGESVDLSQYTL